jgi:hypothetical protein
MSELYPIVLDVLNCQLRKKRNVRQAFNSLSEVGQQILLANGFKMSDHKVEPSTIRKTQYYKRVWELTEAVAAHIPGIEKRGFNDYHIDHITPISYGYKHNIPPHEIANIDNLRMLPYKENMRKGARLTP